MGNKSISEKFWGAVGITVIGGVILLCIEHKSGWFERSGPTSVATNHPRIDTSVVPTSQPVLPPILNIPPTPTAEETRTKFAIQQAEFDAATWERIGKMNQDNLRRARGQ
jgi:hypothetical protein